MVQRKVPLGTEGSRAGCSQGWIFCPMSITWRSPSAAVLPWEEHTALEGTTVSGRAPLPRGRCVDSPCARPLLQRPRPLGVAHTWLGHPGLLHMPGWACPRLCVSVGPTSESMWKSTWLHQVAPGKGPAPGPLRELPNRSTRDRAPARDQPQPWGLQPRGVQPPGAALPPVFQVHRQAGDTLNPGLPTPRRRPHV